jgi:arylsulfatase A-like enzyme
MIASPGRRILRRPAWWIAALIPPAIALAASQSAPPAAPSGVAAAPAKAASAPSRPNLVLITIDSLRRDRVFPGPDGKHDMPGLEALAARAFRFDRAYAASPATSPSHASLLTGLDPVHHGVRHDFEGARLGEGVTTLAERLRRGGYETLAVVASKRLDSDTRLDHGFDRYDDDFPGIRKMVAAWEKERRASEVVDAAARLLDQRTAGKPLFLFVNFRDPHADFGPHVDYDPPEPFKTDHKDDPYGGELASLDAQLSKLLDLLRERSILDGGLLIVAGSHGEALGEHQEVGHGIYLYETTIHVPLLVVRGGGEGATGASLEAPVSLTDIAPTLLDVAGLDKGQGLDGVSFASLLAPPGKGRPTKAPRAGRAIWVETVQPRQAYGWSPLTALIDGDHKVVQGTYAEWFDLAADPAEQHPLPATPRWGKTLLAQGEGRLGDLETPAAKKREILAAVEALKPPWADAPFCVEKDFWPDPRLPEKVALNGELFTAIIQHEQGFVGLSLSTAGKVLETDPDNFAALEMTAFVGIRNRWGNAVLGTLELLQCRYPDRINGIHYLGHYYEQINQVDRALQAMDVMEIIDPLSEDTDFDRAVFLGKQGKIDEAIARLEHSISLGADDFAEMRRDSRLGPLSRDPRFRAMVGLDPLAAPSPPPPQESK